MLAEGDRVLDPGVSAPDEVDGHVLPVVVVASIQAEGVTAALQAIPEVPGQLEEVATPDDFVVDGRILAKCRAVTVVGITGLIWEAIITSPSVKSDQWPEKWFGVHIQYFQ